MHNHTRTYTGQLKNLNTDDCFVDLAVINWSVILMISNDINMTVDQFLKILYVVIEMHAPSIEKRV